MLSYRAKGVRMNRDRGTLSAVSYPIRRTSNLPGWRDESAAMPRWRGEGTAEPQWSEEEVPARRFDASDEWDDKWLRPLLVVPPPHVAPSQPAKVESAPQKYESAPQKYVVEAPAKRADTRAESNPKWLPPELTIAPSPQVAPSAPTKPANAWEPLAPEAIPLQLRMLRWLFRVNQCRAKRYSTPDLVAYYFTGGGPHSFQVRDMSATGLYLMTPERWAPGTLIQMTLHKKDGGGGSPKDSICVLSELVRMDEKGAGFSFVLPDYEYLCAYGLRPEEMLDRRSIERFMRKMLGR
ncbi:MAG: hypothetical protein C5B58_02090 [Acidobacteria bacterium]|nr:MAG: hypothetical protein C5B58_02090 [Acidobacteriota bacterium]